jgi:hypothetical protein
MEAATILKEQGPASSSVHRGLHDRVDTKSCRDACMNIVADCSTSGASCSQVQVAPKGRAALEGPMGCIHMLSWSIPRAKRASPLVEGPRAEAIPAFHEGLSSGQEVLRFGPKPVQQR